MKCWQWKLNITSTQWSTKSGKNNKITKTAKLVVSEANNVTNQQCFLCGKWTECMENFNSNN